MNTISAIINTYNADKYLQLVIDHLRGFDEILVCDMDSTDRTIEIALSNGCRVINYHSDKHTCAEPARDFALRSARSTWAFFVDADEIVPALLTEFLKKFVTNPGDTQGLLIPRKNFVLNRWRRTTYPDFQLRFFRRSAAYWPAEVHSRPVIDGKIDKIRPKRDHLALIHLPPTQAQVMERMNRYTTGELDRNPDRSVNLLTLWFRPWSRFIRSYVIRGGWRYGVSGYINSRNDAIYKFYTLVKTYESNLDEENSELKAALSAAKLADKPDRKQSGKKG